MIAIERVRKERGGGRQERREGGRKGEEERGETRRVEESRGDKKRGRGEERGEKRRGEERRGEAHIVFSRGVLVVKQHIFHRLYRLVLSPEDPSQRLLLTRPTGTAPGWDLLAGVLNHRRTPWRDVCKPQLCPQPRLTGQGLRRGRDPRLCVCVCVCV